MFERYTEKARRTIFFSRHEACQFGSPYIESEHILGLLRENHDIARLLGSEELVRKQIEARTAIREKLSTSVALPLSNECKRVLAYGAEEAERLARPHIGPEHLLLGLLREKGCFAAENLARTRRRTGKVEYPRKKVAILLASTLRLRSKSTGSNGTAVPSANASELSV